MSQNRWMTRDLINDHHRGCSDAAVKEKTFIGLRWYKDGLPSLVACGRVGYTGTLCLNKVYEDDRGEMHLSTIATFTADRVQLRELQETGRLDSGDYHFRLIPAGTSFESMIPEMFGQDGTGPFCSICENGACTCGESSEFKMDGVPLMEMGKHT
jgi:hypothetical protein